MHAPRGSENLWGQGKDEITRVYRVPSGSEASCFTLSSVCVFFFVLWGGRNSTTGGEGTSGRHPGADPAGEDPPRPDAALPRRVLGRLTRALNM